MLATAIPLRAHGWRTRVVAPPAGPLAEELARHGIEHLPFDVRDETGRRRATGQVRESLRRILARERPDVVHANSISMARLSGPVTVDLGLPSVAHLRDIGRLSAQAVQDIGRHDRLLAVSEAVRDDHISQGLPADKVFVLHNGVDLDEFRPRAPTGWLHRELGIDDCALLVGTVGQITLRKGHDLLAGAAVELASSWPQMHWVIVGRRFSTKDETVRFEESVRQTLVTAGLSRRVHWLGERADVARLLAEFTLVVHPARQEPLSRVLLEAAAAGKAIVATAVGGTPEIFPTDAEAARLVLPDDYKALAGAIGELAGNVAQRARLGAAARRRAESAFAAQHCAERLARYYNDVTSRVALS